jgi:hypothetical protein
MIPRMYNDCQGPFAASSGDIEKSAIKGIIFGVDGAVLTMMECHLHKRKEKDRVAFRVRFAVSEVRMLGPVSDYKNPPEPYNFIPAGIFKMPLARRCRAPGDRV